MTADQVVENAQGLVAGAKASGLKPPYSIGVPIDVDLTDDLTAKLKAIDGVVEVKRGKTNGVSVEGSNAAEKATTADSSVPQG